MIVLRGLVILLALCALAPVPARAETGQEARSFGHPIWHEPARLYFEMQARREKIAEPAQASGASAASGESGGVQPVVAPVDDEVDFLSAQRPKLVRRIHEKRDKMIGNPFLVEKPTADAYERFTSRLRTLGSGMSLLDPPKRRDGTIDPVFAELRKNPDSPDARAAAAKALLLQSFDKNQQADLAFALLTSELDLTRADIDSLDAPLGIAGAGSGARALARNQTKYSYRRVLKAPKQGKGLGLSFTSQSRQLGIGLKPLTNGDLETRYAFGKAGGKALRLNLAYADVNRSLQGHYEARLALSFDGFEVGSRVYDAPTSKGASLSLAEGAMGATVEVNAGAPDAATTTRDVAASGRMGTTSVAVRKSTSNNGAVAVSVHEAAAGKSWASNHGRSISVSLSARDAVTVEGTGDAARRTKQRSAGAALSYSQLADNGSSVSGSISTSVSSVCLVPQLALSVAVLDADRDLRAILEAGFDPVGGADSLKLFVEGPIDLVKERSPRRRRLLALKRRVEKDLDAINEARGAGEKRLARRALKIHLDALDRLPGGKKTLDGETRRRAEREVHRLEKERIV